MVEVWIKVEVCVGVRERVGGRWGVQEMCIFVMENDERLTYLYLNNLFC